MREKEEKINLLSERGYALILLMLVVLVLAIASFSFLSLAGQRAIWQRGHSNSQGAFLAAESGIDLALALANEGYFGSDDQLLPLDPPANPGDDPDDQEVLIGENIYDEDDHPLEFPEVSVIPSIQVFRLADEQIGENTGIWIRRLRVESTGTVGQNSRRVVAFLRSTVGLPVESALTFRDPSPLTAFSRNGFTISGFDRNIDGSLPDYPCDAVWGIGIGPEENGEPGDPERVLRDLRHPDSQYVLGRDEEPSVGPVSAPNVIRVIRALAPFAAPPLVIPQGTYNSGRENIYYDPEDKFGVYDPDPEQASPKLTHVKGSIHVSREEGTGDPRPGFGILLVEGYLFVSGPWDYVGLIFVTKGAWFADVDDPQKRITGALFIDNSSNRDPLHRVSDTLKIGLTTIQYSCEAITLVTDWLEDVVGTTITTPYTLEASAEAGIGNREERVAAD